MTYIDYIGLNSQLHYDNWALKCGLHSLGESSKTGSHDCQEDIQDAETEDQIAEICHLGQQ